MIFLLLLDEEAGLGFELFGTGLFVYDDCTDRGEAPLLAFCGDGDGIPRPLALVLLPEPALAVDQIDFL